MFSVLEHLITFQWFPFYFLASFFSKFHWTSGIRDGRRKTVASLFLFVLLDCWLHHKQDALHFLLLFFALAITPSGTTEHVFNRSCLDAAWKQPVGHATCLTTPAESVTFAEGPFFFGSCRSCLCCTTWKLGAPSSQTLLAKREVKKEMEKGLLYFQRSCRVRKKKYYVENWGAKGKQSWLLRLASEPWQLTPPDEWISETPKKSTTESCFLAPKMQQKCQRKRKNDFNFNGIEIRGKTQTNSHRHAVFCNVFNGLLQRKGFLFGLNGLPAWQSQACLFTRVRYSFAVFFIWFCSFFLCE